MSEVFLGYLVIGSSYKLRTKNLFGCSKNVVRSVLTMSLSEVWTFVEEQPVLGSSESFQLVGFPTNDSPVCCVGVRGCWELVARESQYSVFI